MCNFWFLSCRPFASPICTRSGKIRQETWKLSSTKWHVQPRCNGLLCIFRGFHYIFEVYIKIVPMLRYWADRNMLIPTNNWKPLRKIECTSKFRCTQPSSRVPKASHCGIKASPHNLSWPFSCIPVVSHRHRCCCSAVRRDSFKADEFRL